MFKVRAPWHRIRLGHEPESWFGPGMMAVHTKHATSWDELDPVEPLELSDTLAGANDNLDTFRTVAGFGSLPYMGKVNKRDSW